MTIENILTILGSGTITGLIGYFTGKRKNNVETDNLVLQNLELSISIYSEIISDLKVEIQELNRKVQELEQKIDELHEENKRLKSSL